MATRTVCDGCACDVQDDAATMVGRYDPCVYCPACAARWSVHEAEERAAHAGLVRAFETRRAAARATLKTSGLGLARLPDED